jgi:hypothetical protein
MGGSPKKYDPTQSAENPALGLTKEDTAAYWKYYDSTDSGHVQSVSEWAKANQLGIYAADQSKAHVTGAQSDYAYKLKDGEKFDATKADPANSNNPDVQFNQKQANKPPPSVDLTDPTLQAARQSDALSMMTKQDRAQSFLTDPWNDPNYGKKLNPGNTSPLVAKKSTLLGG